MFAIQPKLRKAIVSLSLVAAAALLSSCGMESSETNSDSVASVQEESVESIENTGELTEPIGTKSDVNACSSVKIAFEDLFAMSQSGQYSADELNQQRIGAYESGLLSVESERLYYLLDFLRSWNMNPVGLSVNEYREMQSICESLGVSFSII